MMNSVIFLCIVGFAAAIVDATGCGKIHRPGFDDSTGSHHIVSGGRDRYYGVYVPDSYNDDPTKKWPLIVDFHGRGGTPKGQYQNSMYYANEKGKEYLVVYPAGIKKAWQGASYAEKGVNDLQFITDLLAHMRQNYCIDSNRIYASGKSNGGGFVNTLACSDNGDEFAAFAMAAAALYTDNNEGGCPHKRAILEVHGIKDQIINYHGNPNSLGGSVPDIPTWVLWWGERDQCEKQTIYNLREYQIISFSCSGLEKVVEHYQVYNLGHCWPSSTGDNTDSTEKNMDACTDRSLDFTSVVVDFFGRWSQSNKLSVIGKYYFQEELRIMM